MNRNRVPWMISTVALLVALVTTLVALSPRAVAQDPAPDEPVVAVPVAGQLVSAPAMVDPAAVDATVSPAFTYQGVLRSGGAPANGTFDFQFQLFNAATGGTQRGPTLLADNVAVADGRFTTLLNFGNVYGNEALWIAVGVRNGSSTGAFTTLNPRQSLTAVPFARASADTAALASRVATLEAKTTALETLLAGVTRQDNGKTLRFSGMNVQVVSGAGSTDAAVNGLGNLIIGYNETLNHTLDRSGSHNLVVGRSHQYSSWGGVVFGEYNWAGAPESSVLGGNLNTAFGTRGVVVGGLSNNASGEGAVVGGGDSNTASGLASVVSGGRLNSVANQYSTISGGVKNQTQFGEVTISGGQGIDALVAGLWYGNLYQCVPNRADASGC